MIGANGGKNNVPTLIADLMTASFDVLANAINRTEQAEAINVYRSFLTNKLPALLQSFSSMIYPPLTTESCITDALNRMDPSGDPYSSQAFDILSSSGMLSEARQEFLFACALYSLIPEASIESILGDVPMQSLPEAGKYASVDLVAQCTANPGRIEELIGELENVDGNSAEIAQALIEVGNLLIPLLSTTSSLVKLDYPNLMPCQRLHHFEEYLQRSVPKNSSIRCDYAFYSACYYPPTTLRPNRPLAGPRRPKYVQKILCEHSADYL